MWPGSDGMHGPNGMPAVQCKVSSRRVSAHECRLICLCTCPLECKLNNCNTYTLEYGLSCDLRWGL